MGISKIELEKIIYQNFPNAKVTIKDTVGDMNHYSLEIADKSFDGLSLLAQHKLVKKALENILKDKLHAITIKTTNN